MQLLKEMYIAMKIMGVYKNLGTWMLDHKVCAMLTLHTIHCGCHGCHDWPVQGGGSFRIWRLMQEHTFIVGMKWHAYRFYKTVWINYLVEKHRYSCNLMSHKCMENQRSCRLSFLHTVATHSQTDTADIAQSSCKQFHCIACMKSCVDAISKVSPREVVYCVYCQCLFSIQ